MLNPHLRIGLTHGLVVVILLINIFLFTENIYALLLQGVLVIAVILHHQDDVYVKRELFNVQKELQDDRDIFNDNIIISETNLQGEITYVNNKFVTISGYSRQELLGKPHNIVRHNDTPSETFKVLWNDITNNKIWHDTLRNSRKNGTSYWVESTILPLFKNGKKIGYRAIRFDVTDKIIAKSRENLLQNIIDNSDDMILVLENHKISLINKTLLNFLDFSSIDNFLSKHECICELFEEREGYLHNTDRNWLEKLKESPIASKVVLKNKKSQEEFFFELHHSESTNDDYALVALHDISFFEKEKKSLQAQIYQGEESLQIQEQQLQEQSKRFEFAINTSRDGFWDYNLITFEFYLNEGWKERLGFTKEDAPTYVDFMNLIIEEERIEPHLAIHDAIEAHDGTLEYVHYRTKYTLITKYGERINIDDVGDVFFDDNKHPIRITGFQRDITAQVKQAKIIETQNRLSAMGEMLSNVSHQWKQPIGAINNILNDIEFDIELEDLESIPSDDFLEKSKKIKELTRYLGNTIEDFRSMSSSDKRKEHFSITSLIDEALKIMEISLTRHEVNVDVAQSIQSAQELYGYKRELIQVVVNILNNAKDILKEKGIKEKQIHISFESTSHSESIFINDNAGGVPETIIGKIFEPYFTTKHESMGTGIGLYMSQKIVKEYFNGDLSVRNNDEGALFNICLDKDLLLK